MPIDGIGQSKWRTPDRALPVRPLGIFNGTTLGAIHRRASALEVRGPAFAALTST